MRRVQTKAKRPSPSKKRLEELEDQVRELSETLEAIRNGEIDGLIINAQDGEQIYTLQTAEHPYRILVEKMNEGAVTLVEHDIVSYSNSSFAQIVHLDLEKVIGQSIHNFVAAQSTHQLQMILKRAWKSGAAKGEIDFINRSTLLPVLLSASLIEQHGISALCLVVTDLSEQKRSEQLKRAEEERVRQVQRLEAERIIADTANQAKSNFLANMSHEIRTPLGAILGFAQLINDPSQSVTDRQACVSTILRNGDQLARVINEVLDLSKIESDKMEIESIEFSLKELIEDVTSLMSLQAQGKGISFTVRYASKLPQVLISDPTRVRQILFNIIGNAVKFTSRGSVQLTVSVTEVLSAEIPSSQVLLCMKVSDTGPGLDQEQRSRIFQPFMQADNTTTRKFGGTGLGLVLSRKLARALGGDLVIEDTKPGVGSVFVATIQTRAVWRKALSPRLIEADSTGLSRLILKDACVLVVDDAPDNRTLVTHFLKAAGAVVECAIDGNDGVTKAMNGSFDVVLMDIQMPGIDGFEALKQLRALHYTKPVVAFTAHAMKGDRERCLNAGFSDHLVKPINRVSLIQTVADFKACPV